jgi:hypothetical protein
MRKKGCFQVSMGVGGEVENMSDKTGRNEWKDFVENFVV